MSQIETLPEARLNPYLSPRAYRRNPVRQVHGPGPQSVVELAAGGHQPVSRPRSRSAGGNWTTTPSPCCREFTPERLEMRAAELVLYSRINHAFRRLKEYMREKPLWGRTHAGVLGSKPVAYFSLEFGVHESVPIYSGGLGVLSGDHIKSASGLGVPLVAMRPVLRPGLFQAAPGHATAGSRKSISTPRSRTCPWSPPAAPTASRSPSRSKPAPAGCWPRCG